MEYRRPRKLVAGDTVAVLSPSWGGPSLFAAMLEKGLRELESLGLRVKELPTTRMADEIEDVAADREALRWPADRQSACERVEGGDFDRLTGGCTAARCETRRSLRRKGRIV